MVYFHALDQLCPICLTNNKDMAFGCGHQVDPKNELVFRTLSFPAYLVSNFCPIAVNVINLRIFLADMR